MTTRNTANYMSSAGNDLAFEQKALLGRSSRVRLNVVPICGSVMWPWFLFCLMYGAMAFSLRYNYVWATVLILIVGGLIVLLSILRTAIIVWRNNNEPAARREPNWWIFFSVSLIIAYVLGIVIGNQNYWYYTEPYCDYESLNEYSNVSVDTTSGQELMDAGRLTFASGAYIDTRKTMGYTNTDTYCVAPVSTGTTTLSTYDYWAVGLDCCSSIVSDFHCADYSSSTANAGLRLLREEQLPYFEKAVDQATAAYSIQASHPIFFYWTTNATEEMEYFSEEAMRYYLVGLLVHFFWQGFMVLLAVLVFAKLA